MLLRSPKSAIGFICILGALVGCIVVYKLLTKGESAVGSLNEFQASTRGTSSEDHRTNATQSNSVSPLRDLDSNSVDEIDLQQHCGDPLGTLSSECIQVLDSYFPTKPLVFEEFSWIKLPNPLTYQDTFDDPAKDREGVLAALRRPECRLENGEIRWDLAGPCNAKSFANYANFYYFCIERDSYWKTRVKTDAHNSISKFELPEYDISDGFTRYGRWNPPAWPGETILERRWIDQQCANVDLASLELDSDRDASHLKVLEEIAARIGSRWKITDLDLSYLMPRAPVVRDSSYLPRVIGRRPEPFRVTRVLMAISARLGDEWSTTAYATQLIDPWEEHLTKEMAWMQQLKLMKLDHATRVTTLDLAIRTALKLEDAGLEFEWIWLVNHVCNPERFSYMYEVTCQGAIEHLRNQDEFQDNRRWNALEKFEFIAMELGLYDEVPLNEHRLYDPDHAKSPRLQSRVRSLQSSISRALTMMDEGLEFDWDQWITDYCDRPRMLYSPDEMSCQEAIEEVKKWELADARPSSTRSKAQKALDTVAALITERGL